MAAYPTMEEVEGADRMQLAKWYRYLHSPGSCGIGHSAASFVKVMEVEAAIMKKIVARFEEEGGMSPAISKAIGWD